MIGLALRLAVLALCAVLLWRAVDWGAAARLLRAADHGWLLAALGLLTAQTALSAERWRVTAAQLGLRLGFGHALREYYLGQVVNQSLPGGVLGDAGRAVRSRGQAGLLAASQAVVFERLAGQLGLIAVLAVGLSLGLALPGHRAWPDWFTTTAAVLLGGLVAGALAAFTILRWAGPARRAAAPALRALTARDIRRKQILLSLATALCNIAAFAACIAAIGAPTPVLGLVTVLPIVLFSMVLPLSVGGWGLREGAAVVLFPVLGATADQALAASVAFGLTILASVLPGLVLARSARQSASAAD